MSEFSDVLLSWYRANARDLPWRRSKDPYSVWVSEIMLQQTQIDTVIDYYSSFMRRFPSLEVLAKSSEEDVLKCWEGLGYYSRARNLRKGAEKIYFELSGIFPKSKEEWMKIPGVGDYASSSIASICFDDNCIALDGNLFRVFSRLNEDASFLNGACKKRAIAFYDSLLPQSGSGDFNQALMEIGETLCLPKGKPLCSSCPLSSMCRAYKNSSYGQFPLPKPKKEKKHVHLFVFLIETQGEYLTRKRPAEGLLGGLYEFPTFESLEEAECFVTEAGLDFASNKKIGKSVHQFSHVIWDMTWFSISAVCVPNLESAKLVSIPSLREEITLPNAFSNFLKTNHLCGF